jgi:hypothetical protein
MISATNRFVGSAGTIHVLGKMGKDGTNTECEANGCNNNGSNNQTLGLERADPTPATLSQDKAHRLNRCRRSTSRRCNLPI